MKKKSLPERIFLHLKEGWLAALIVFAAALGANFERPMRLDEQPFANGTEAAEKTDGPAERTPGPLDARP